jgi:hypothetical protein
MPNRFVSGKASATSQREASEELTILQTGGGTFILRGSEV